MPLIPAPLLADAELAHALEASALLAKRDRHEWAWSRPGRQGLRFARSCYGHLAGHLAVLMLDALLTSGRLRSGADGFELTDSGREWLAELGLQPAPPSARRRFAYPCLDGSERRDHLAGQLADEILQHCIAQGWLRRVAGRALELTMEGRRVLLSALEQASASAGTRG